MTEWQFLLACACRYRRKTWHERFVNTSSRDARTISSASYPGIKNSADSPNSPLLLPICPQRERYMDYWEITDATIVYRGLRQDLPEFLPGFTMPVPKAWFNEVVRKRRQKKKVVYQADAYAVTTGDIMYDCHTAYTAELWADSLKVISFAVQVDWAETPRAKSDRSLALMQVSIFRPDRCRRALEKQRTVGTTQSRFLAFLRSGRVEDLESSSDPSPAISWKDSHGNETIQAA